MSVCKGVHVAYERARTRAYVCVCAWVGGGLGFSARCREAVGVGWGCLGFRAQDSKAGFSIQSLGSVGRFTGCRF